MRALVTRPEADTGEISAALEARGIEVAAAPMLTIVPTGQVPGLDGVQALMFTSANGVRTFADVSTRRDMPVFAVGDATARCAASLGFARVTSAGADSQALAKLVRGALDPGAGAVLHAAGEAVAGDPAGALEAAGFEVERAVLYRADAARELDRGTRDLLGKGELDMVLFFSPRAAQTFVTLVEQAALPAACRALSAICLSEAVAEAAGPGWRAVLTAQSPNMAALLDEIDAEAAHLKPEC